ncbi:tRNA uridine-5-carboxymethylaminomethyl(34) synthesis enzyme MnmG [candidate division KSB1 bacterium]|nr:tRNA uridine-5-carboxymethylaminomethyl(34) synthesis enzyme MnmG [candidate division KSB1 bacterium]
MIDSNKIYDVIVVGAGHAGCEAALAAARMGMKTVLFTINMSTVAKMSCNPAIGGLAKGHLVREIDALGGVMGTIIDETGIQFRMLNKSKGPAVWSPRAQADKIEYSERMLHLLETQKNLELKQAMVTGVTIENDKITGVKLFTGSEVRGKSVILTAGTFLNGLIHIGLFSYSAGRDGEFAAKGLTENLVSLGFKSERLKTGTPPRLDGNSIDFDKMTVQPGDAKPQPFSYQTKAINRKQVPCYLTNTVEQTHKILLSGLNRSPLYSGKIIGTGPRYCPSIETKLVRFADKTSHQLYLEPESLRNNEYYVNGYSTSLPEDIQWKAIRTIPGLEKAEITRPGYAIEYDFFPPSQLRPTLETKYIENLYFAGQINGTSGYEEAAAQGLMAAINAVLKLHQQEPFILARSQAYIGVLIDDLITKEITEPYRMFTSLAEYRLLLRQDNADMRLMDYGNSFGLLDKEVYEQFCEKRKLIKDYYEDLQQIRPDLNAMNQILEGQNTSQLKEKENLYKILKRPEITLDKLNGIAEHPLFESNNDNRLMDQVRQQLEIEIKYEGYLARQNQQIERFSKMENHIIPEKIDYSKIKSLSSEAKEKFDQVRPRSIGQASRIAGVSPADISVLLIYLKK